MSHATASIAQHWNEAYADGDADVSWRPLRPTVSLELIGDLAPDLGAPVIDVGGGSSALARHLLDAGQTDVTVLDVSEAGLALAQKRLGDRQDGVSWLVEDLRTWSPDRTYAVWHDRAVLHFMTTPAERRRYADTVRSAVGPGGGVVIGTFAPDGPESCSGLPVRRSGPDELLALLGRDFSEVRRVRELHRTPAGRSQAFAWLVARRAG